MLGDGCITVAYLLKTMKKQLLVEEYVKLLLETEGLAASAPVVLDGPFAISKARGDYTVYRDFPLVATPEMMQLLHITEDELEEGCLTHDHEITFDAEVYHQKASRGSWEQPGDPAEFLLENIQPITLNGLALSKSDAAKVLAAMGELTDDETQGFYDSYVDNFSEPDY